MFRARYQSLLGELHRASSQLGTGRPPALLVMGGSRGGAVGARAAATFSPRRAL